MPGFSPTRLASAMLIAVAAGIPFTPIVAQQPDAVRVPRAVLERYVGEYVYPGGGQTIKVSVNGDTLFQETAGRRLAYMPISESVFMLGPNFTAEFTVDPDGATQMLSNGKGIEFLLRRKGSRSTPVPPSAAPVAAVRVPRAVLERYVGTYAFVPGQMDRTDLRIVILLKGDTLIREGAGPRSVLTPISDTRFRVGATSALVEFVVDEAGVTQIMGTGFQQALARLISKR